MCCLKGRISAPIYSPLSSYVGGHTQPAVPTTSTILYQNKRNTGERRRAVEFFACIQRIVKNCNVARQHRGVSDNRGLEGSYSFPYLPADVVDMHLACVYTPVIIAAVCKWHSTVHIGNSRVFLFLPLLPIAKLYLILPEPAIISTQSTTV